MNIIVDVLNYWQVVKLEISKNDDIDEDDLAKEILHGIESRMSKKIMKGDYEAMRTKDPDTDRYYTVEVDYYVYAAQDDKSYERVQSS